MLLHDKLKNYRLLLASHSPRRQQLLRDCGLAYVLIDKYEVEELYPDTLAATEVPLYLSQLKSHAYPSLLTQNEILLTADTVVVLDSKVLGKPANGEHARTMLRELSGRHHTVVTGITFRTAEREHSFAVRTNVWFRALTDEEIAYYVDAFQPMDKAGSYGIQEWIGYAAIEKINGSFYNVMGLPIQKVYVELEKFIR